MPAPEAIYLPVAETLPAVRLEVRCHATTAINNLDIGDDKPLEKFSLIIHRTGEPQDKNGEQAGRRRPLPNFNVPLADALGRDFTAAGVTAKGFQILALLNEVIGTYKGDGDVSLQDN